MALVSNWIYGCRYNMSSAISQAIRLEREKRRTTREQKMWEILTSPAVIEALIPPVVMAGTFTAGKYRFINRDLAGFLFGMEAVLAAAKHGVSDKYALLGIFEAAAMVYVLAVPPTKEESIITLEPTSVLGSDKRLFGWAVPGVTPGHPASEWAMGPFQYVYDKIRGESTFDLGRG